MLSQTKHRECDRKGSLQREREEKLRKSNIVTENINYLAFKVGGAGALRSKATGGSWGQSKKLERVSEIEREKQ